MCGMDYCMTVIKTLIFMEVTITGCIYLDLLEQFVCIETRKLRNLSSSSDENFCEGIIEHVTGTMESQ
jgi:hypothetical protein